MDDGTHLEALGTGDVNIQVFDGINWIDKYLADVRYVPTLKYNLFSNGSAVNKGFRIIEDKSECKILKEDKVVAIGERFGGLCKLKARITTQKKCLTTLKKSQSIQSWHERLAHIGFDRLKDLLKKEEIQPKESKIKQCVACLKGKAHRQSFKTSKSQANEIGEFIHSDLCGPMEANSVGNSKYFLLFKDDFSNYRKIYFLKNKSETSNCLKNFIKCLKNETGKDVKILRTDNGLEYINTEVKAITDKLGIKHKKTVSYTPQQNGRAERENRTLVEAARTMLLAKNLPKKLWAEAVNTAAYTLNRTDKERKNNDSPHQIWHQKEPKLEDFETFGTRVLVHVPKQLRQKWDSKTKEGIFVGYSQESKGLRIWFKDKDKIETHRDVYFINDEEEIKQENRQKKEMTDINESKQLDSEEDENTEEEETNTEEESETEYESVEDFIEPIESIDGEMTEQDYENEESNKIEEDTQSDSHEAQGRVLRDRQTLKSPDRYTDYISIMSNNLFLTDNSISLTFKEALEHNDADRWKGAMDDELRSLKENQF